VCESRKNTLPTPLGQPLSSKSGGGAEGGGDKKVLFCLTGPYLTRRATIGRLADPPLAEGGPLDPPIRAAPASITAYTARGSSD
jgi:hypothetical protein